MALSLSRFPALVQTPEGSHDRAAYIVRDGVAEVHVLVGGKVTVVATKAGASSQRQQGMFRAVDFDDGSTWLDSKGRGCGCSSPLKTFYNRNLPRRVGT